MRLVLIGKGPIGAGAARHLAGSVDELVLVGPDEPARRDDHPGVFASHYDRARITRRVDPDPVWSAIAQAAIGRYPELEALSGVRFHHPCGFLAAGAAGSETLEAMRAVAERQGIALEHGATHPRLALPADSETLLERGAAGWVDPRAMVRAQVLAAIAQGCRVERLPAWALRPGGDGRTRVILDDGSEVAADRVLICAGAFSGVTGLVDGALPMRAEGRTVVLARVDPEAMGRHARPAEPAGDPYGELDTLPALIDVRDEPTDPAHIYLLPPVRYPDGHRYVKIGSGAWSHPLKTLEALQEWFRGPPDARDVDRLHARLVELLPMLANAESRAEPCAVAQTASGYPIVDWVEPGRVAVATGGNGQGAKGADEIGRLGARLVLDQDPEVPFDPRLLRL